MPGLISEKTGSIRFPTIALAAMNGSRNRLPAAAANVGRVVIVTGLGSFEDNEKRRTKRDSTPLPSAGGTWFNSIKGARDGSAHRSNRRDTPGAGSVSLARRCPNRSRGDVHVNRRQPL